HGHPHEDHAFVVLEGEATFSGPDGDLAVARQHEGIVIPAGAVYCFRNTGTGNLVMLRVGSGLTTYVPGNDDNRHDADGTVMPFTEAERASAVVAEGQWFGPAEEDR